MNQVLVTVSRGIIEEVVFFHDPGSAIRALSKYVKTMNIEHNDAALYDADGMTANAKHFLDENDEYVENKALIAEVAKETKGAVYIIGNPKHRLGFMIVSPDDPLGFDDPAEALSQLGQMRQDFGRHLKLYCVVPVEGPVADKADLKKHNEDCDIENFDYSLVEEYL